MAGSIEVTWCITDIWSPGNNNQHSQCTIDMPWIFFFPLHCTPNIYLNRSHRVPMILKTFTSNGIKWASYTRIFKGKQNQKKTHFWEMIKKIQKCIISLSGFSQLCVVVSAKHPVVFVCFRCCRWRLAREEIKRNLRDKMTHLISLNCSTKLKKLLSLNTVRSLFWEQRRPNRCILVPTGSLFPPQDTYNVDYSLCCKVAGFLFF